MSPKIIKSAQIQRGFQPPPLKAAFESLDSFVSLQYGQTDLVLTLMVK